MTKEQMDRARLSFQANWVGYSRKSDGAVLGLTVADRVISNLGGELEIESATDTGTTVIVRLPACPADGENVTEMDLHRKKTSPTERQVRVKTPECMAHSAIIWDCRFPVAVIVSAPFPNRNSPVFHGARYRHRSSHCAARQNPRR